MMTKKSSTFKIGRDARTGQFIPVKEALRRPNTTSVERIPKPGKSGGTDDTGPMINWGKK
jgi:hypothetical protein